MRPYLCPPPQLPLFGGCLSDRNNWLLHQPLPSTTTLQRGVAFVSQTRKAPVHLFVLCRGAQVMGGHGGGILQMTKQLYFWPSPVILTFCILLREPRAGCMAYCMVGVAAES